MASLREFRILFFDGKCVLCNATVDWLISRDKNARLKFASLQGQTARVLLDEGDIVELSTLIFFDGGQIYRRSSAALRAMISIGRGWQLLAFFLLLPTSWRDRIYNFIARRRYRWFEETESCRRPVPEDQERFLL